jgi:hypothetical protein
MVPVEITGVSDSADAPVSVHVTRVTQDEPISHRAFEGACFDAKVVDGKLYLRRERQDGGNGRVYRISFTAVARDGGTADGTVLVAVPGKAGVRLAVNDGQIYNSLEACAERSGHMVMATDDQRGTFKTSLGLPRTEGARAILEYTLAEPGEVTLAIFDVAGRRVASLADAVQETGVHRAFLQLQHVAHGIYFVRMRAGGRVFIRRMPILRTAQ